ncbi:MAG TPA: DUF6716 putative glycosyltransferase [Gemmatimonadaceae bacterium]|nr:DUF6716 putative glycosyltransferase [Gemmatimonadaceae bacterium]
MRVTSGVLDLDNLSAEDNALFNATASETRRRFDTFVETVSREHVEDIDWIVGSIASRNKFQSPLFIRCCRLAFVNRKLAAISEALEIRVADRALADVLRRRVLRAYPNVVVRSTQTATSRIWQALRAPRQFLIAGATFVLRWAGRSRPRPPRNQPIFLIDTFVLNNASGDAGSIINGVYQDRYYPGMLDALTSEERSIVYFLPTIVGFRNPIRAFRQIRSAKPQFIVHDDYLTIADYLFAMRSPFRLTRLAIQDVEFEGYELGPMLREERRQHCSDVNSLQGLLYYRFAKRLAEAGVHVRLLVDWYENQAIDRGMIVGFHRFHPRTAITGYRGYVAAKDLLVYSHPTNTEVRGGAVPDIVAVTGQRLRDDIREFAKDVRVEVAPGFRFQKLWRARKSIPERDTYAILVGLPIDLADCAHILRLLATDPRIAGNSSLVIRVKPHPTASPAQILSLLPSGQFPEHWQFVSGDFHDALDMANLLIGNASTVCLEALAKGVPVIVIAPSTGIVQNVIPESLHPDMWAICRDAAEIVKAIDRYRLLTADQRSDFERWGREIRQAYFSPVTRETVLRFLAFDGAEA